MFNAFGADLSRRSVGVDGSFLSRHSEAAADDSAGLPRRNFLSCRNLSAGG